MLEGDVVLLHLAPNGIETLLPTVYFGVNSGIRGIFPQLLDNPLDQVLPFRAQIFQPPLDRIARFIVQFDKGEIFQIIAKTLHSDTLGQGCIYLHRLRGDAFALFWVFYEMKGTHIVQPVGQLDQQHADIVRHCQQKLSEILSLLGPIRLQLDLRQLGDPVDKRRDLAPEDFFNLLFGGNGIFNRVMKKRSYDRRCIQF